MRVADLRKQEIHVLPEDATLVDAAIAMKAKDIGFLPVREGDTLAGVITDRDIVVRGLAEKKDPTATRALELATREVVTCRDTDTLEIASERMAQAKVRRLIVLDEDGRVAGTISLGDLAMEDESAPAAESAMKEICSAA